MSATTTSDLTALLEEAQARGFLGPGPIEAHVQLAETGQSLLAPGMVAVDLGSGGGALGLPLAMLDPDVSWLWVESSATRADFLRRAVGRLGLEQRATVVADPAEVAGRDATWRGRCDLVVARSFGPPATTAECGAAFLRVGGILAVTEPPQEQGERWPASGLAALGLEARDRVGAFQTLVQVSACPERFPRRTGVPRQRPLF